MIRFLQVNVAKNLPNVKAAVELVNGQPVSYDPATGTVNSGYGKCAWLVKAAEVYTGEKAMRMPSDGEFEVIAAGAICHLVPVYVGEHYATSQVTGFGKGREQAALEPGDRIGADGYQFGTNADGDWIFVGEYNDPTGIRMAEIVYDPIGTAADGGDA